MEDLHSDSLPAAMEGSTSSASPQAAMEASTSASPQVAPIPSRITGIGEGEIQRLIRDLEGLSSSIGELKQGLERLRSPLVALSESEDPSNRITAKCWAKQVRKLCYDTGDYLYDFMHSGNEFKLLGARARDANGRLEWCGIQPQTPSTSTACHLPAAPRADLIDLGHMVDEVNNLIGNQKELKVVSIVGPEGVGKTTLAKRLYQSVGGNGRFHFRAFLRASPKPDIRRLLTSMFMEIQRKRPSCRLNAYQLIDSIATYLQNKPYLIVIDDLWTAAVWEIISRAFPDGDCGSRIITTTQTKGVALACCGYQSKYVFMMEPLIDAQSENLFFRTVFGSESGCPWHLEEVSREIIRKCGGLPLAIINIASMLPSGLNSEELKSIRDSLPYTPRTNPTPEWMKEVVNLLYSTLRPHLKTCLLYFSMYPEGCIVRKGDLVKQWVVEGFLDGVQGQATEEIARGYFDELVRRGMIQPVDIKNGEVLSCTLHHMIHDVIVNKSMEENFVIIANYFQSAIPLPDKVRRLSVQFGVAKSAHIPESIIVSELRSLAFSGFFQCLRSIAEYRHLRVLILDIWADEDEDAFDLTGIRELLRLRYLKIACNIAVKLPDEIQQQQYLEMLDVDATVVAIPWDIGGLTRLSSIKIAVRELLCKDIYFLQILPALTALSVHVKTPPTETIVLDKGGFLNLKFFTFRCSAPHLLIKEKAMPKIEKLNLCFNAHEARQDSKKPIIIEHLATLKEISVKIGGAAADVDSALANAVTNDPKNPRLQLIESREDEEHGTLEEQDEIMEKDAHEYSGKQDGGSGRCEIMGEDRDDTYVIQDDGSGNDEHNKTDSREGLDDTYGIQDDGTRKDEHKEADSSKLKYKEGLVDTYGIQDDGTRKDEHKEADSRVGLDDTYEIQDDDTRKDEHKEADSREMEVALGSAAMLLGKVLTMLSDGLVAAYVDSIQLGHNSQQIKAKLAHTQAQAQGSHVGDNPGLQRLLEKLSRDADQAEDLLDEVHYFQIHDKLHGTTYATTQDLDGLVRHQALHAGSAVRHTLGSWFQCFSCSRTPKRDGSDDAAAAVAGVTNSNSATADDGDTLHFDRVSMSSKIKSVLQGVQSHCDSVSNLLGNIPSNTTALAVILNRPPTASMIIQDTLYGREDIFEETVNRITTVTGATQTVSILPIVGPGGIGKTTFAQHLYHDARTQEHFQVRVWVCVSNEFDVVKLTREILAYIPATEEGGSSGVANETTNLDHLQRSIVHRLKSKRFLIVLDDIWKCDDEDQWKTLLAPFTKREAKGSMVLVTTRFPKLAQMMETVGSLELAGLESNDFFTFFEACMFGEDNKPEKYEDELAGIARRIANKLKGSPLAAKTVGRLLHKDLSQKHWNGVLEKHEWLKQQNNHDIMPSLKISYDYLPFDLKKCFSYCGLFPEAHVFTSSEINHFWVAMGIIDSNHQDDRNYLEELLDSGFLMKKFSYRRDQYCYVMHDLMHELSKSVSAQECLNISGLDFRADAIPQSVRHLSINIEDRYDANFEEEMCKLRERIDIANLWTLMIFRGYEEERIVKILKDTFKEINSLRVLFLVVKSAQSFPYRFSKLIHLQYLKISSTLGGDREMTLPSTLSRFYHLKFLDLDDWRGRSDLPEDFSHLENLHDFHGKSELHSNIRNVGKMKHLQELKEFHVKKESMGFELTELGALTELEGRLIIRGLEHVATKEEAAAAKLMLKRNLKELELLWGRDGPTTDAGILDALRPHSNLGVLRIANHGGTVGPSWLCLDIWLTSLETLTLEGLSWSTLPPFGKLPNLKGLKLKKNSGIHQFGPRCGGAPGKCFMRLKQVELYEMPELAEWVVEPSCCSFPSLEEIICIDCPNLRVMPLSEVCCTNLRRLEVCWCPKMFLPSMPHTSTLTNLVVKRDGTYNSETLLSYDGKKLVVDGYGGALAYHNLDKVEDMYVRGYDGLFPEELDGSIVLHSVKSLKLEVSHLTSSKSSSSKVLNCFPALSVLHIDGDADHDYEGECVMQFPLSSSLQELTFRVCKGLVLVPVENGGGIQEDKSLLQSLSISGCGQLFCRWPMGESETIFPFPASLRELDVWDEPSIKSMALLSNLTSLTTLRLKLCCNLTVDGFNPLTTVNLIQLEVHRCNTLAADMLSEVASQRAKLLPAGYISRLEKLTVDDISGLLVSPICNLLAPALHTLVFLGDERMESFTEEQDKALQFLTSLQKLSFWCCEGLQSLPQGLHRLSSLKELSVLDCPKIRSMPKDGLPVSLRKLYMNCRSAEIDKQIEKIKRTNPDLSVQG